MAVVSRCHRRSRVGSKRAFGSCAGFTLVELLAAAAIVVILLSIVLPALRGGREQAAAAQARAELASIVQALEEYRRAYGDYPQTGDFAQAAPIAAEEISSAHAQAKLLNALTGVFGPRSFGPTDRQNGRTLLDPLRFTLEIAATGANPGAASSSLAKRETAACLLDPWGRRYLYYYKRSSAPGAWQAQTFILYSAGADGAHLPPRDDGRYDDHARQSEENADNIHAFPHD